MVRSAEYENVDRRCTVPDDYAGLFDNTEARRLNAEALRGNQGMIKFQQYEEPWDLSSAQLDLADQCDVMLIRVPGDSGERMASWSERGNNKMPYVVKGKGVNHNGRQAESVTGFIAPDGRQKPTGLKPHEKDERGRDGYERPWDLKPHQKDDRPLSEYDAPWDNKMKSVESELIAAKIGKESTRTSQSGSRLSHDMESFDINAVQGQVRARGYTDDVERGQEGRIIGLDISLFNQQTQYS